MDDLAVARSRAVLARLQVLRLARRTKEAQVLWSAVEAGQIPGVTFDVALAGDSGAVLAEHAAMEHALLLLRQDDDQRYCHALEVADGCRARLAPSGGAASILTGHRRRRLIAKLSVVYSQAGREDVALSLAEDVLQIPRSRAGHWYKRGVEEIRREVAGVPDIRAADHLGNLAVRLARLAFIESLAGTVEARTHASELLRIAADAGCVSLERRRTEHGRQISHRALLNVKLGQAALLRADESRLEALRAVSSEIWAFLVSSQELPDNGPAVLTSRYALYGQAVVEQALTVGAPARDREAHLGRVALAPMAALHDLDADYELAVGVRYADACAVSGDGARARALWQKLLARLRRARPNREDVARQLQTRLRTGEPPPR